MTATALLFLATPDTSAQSTPVDEFRPVGIASYGGEIFATDPSAGVVLRVSGAELEPFGEPLVRPWGLTIRADGALCVSHYTSSDPLTRLTAVSCEVGDSWHNEVSGIGNGINGIVAHDGGFWLAAWRDTEVESRDGLVTFVRNDKVEVELHLPSLVPQHISLLPNGVLLVSAWSEDAAGYTAGRLLRIDPGAEPVDFYEAAGMPAGVAHDGEKVWVADSATGELIALGEEGGEILRQGGFDSAAGIVVISKGAVCVAQEQTSRISCFGNKGDQIQQLLGR